MLCVAFCTYTQHVLAVGHGMVNNANLYQRRSSRWECSLRAFHILCLWFDRTCLTLLFSKSASMSSLTSCRLVAGAKWAWTMHVSCPQLKAKSTPLPSCFTKAGLLVKICSCFLYIFAMQRQATLKTVNFNRHQVCADLECGFAFSERLSVDEASCEQDSHIHFCALVLGSSILLWWVFRLCSKQACLFTAA